MRPEINRRILPKAGGKSGLRSVRVWAFGKFGCWMATGEIAPLRPRNRFEPSHGFYLFQWWCCQTNSNQSQFATKPRNLCGTKLPPLVESGGSLEFEIGSWIEVAFLVEVIVNWRMDGRELLQGSKSPEPQHRSLSSSKQQVWILCSIVQPATRRLSSRIADYLHHCAVVSQPIRDDNIRLAVASHRFSEKFLCRFAITALCDIAFENFTLVVDGSPQIVRFSVNLHEYFVQMPLPVRMSMHLIDPFLTYLRSEDRTRSIPPKLNGFVANINTFFEE